MSTILWRGDAAAVRQVDTVVIGGSWATNDTASITINGKSITFTVGATQTVAAVVAGLVAAWNLSTAGEHAEITAADANPNVTLTMDTTYAGRPFTATVAKSAASGTITISTTTANSGPADLAIAANFSGGALPTNGDTLVFQNSDKPCLYNLDALDDVTGLLFVSARSFAGNGVVGLPRYNVGVANVGYYEYRPRYLKAGFASITIGQGDGQGSGRIMLDAAGSSPTITVDYTGTSKDSGIPALLIHNTGATTVLNVNKGTVGVAIYEEESATIDSLNIGYQTSQASDSNVTCGPGVTLDEIHQTGGKLFAESNVASLVQDGGEATISGTATLGFAEIGGTVYDESSGTWEDISIGPAGVYDHRRSMIAKTINGFVTIEDGGKFFDPFAMVTAANGFICDPEEVTFDLGKRF
jgi:hypothetical protein